MFSFINRSGTFSSSRYWEERYKRGGDSGAGSYNELAAFKAETLNRAIAEYSINRITEFGCGDGNQLAMFNVPDYIGLDISETVIKNCIQKFKSDKTKSFFIYNSSAFTDNHKIFLSDAAISLDVIFHLVEFHIFEKYLFDLFCCASKLVIIYGADLDYSPETEHELYRKFTGYIAKNFQGWKLDRTLKNKYPAKNNTDPKGSLADFYFYTRAV